MSFDSRYITVLERELHYTEWGCANTQTVVMWHGLARTGRDFDAIAAPLSRRYRVICPDTLGRGLSQWSPEPDAEYCLAFYARLAAAFCDALGIGHMLQRKRIGQCEGRDEQRAVSDHRPVEGMVARQLRHHEKDNGAQQAEHRQQLFCGEIPIGD